MSYIHFKVTKESAVLCVDGSEIRDTGCLCIFSLVRSAFAPGLFELFVCGCGSAGCGGYEEIEVEHDLDRIYWHVPDSYGREYYWSFDKKEYARGIEAGLEAILKNIYGRRKPSIYFPIYVSHERLNALLEEIKGNHSGG